MVQAEVGQQAVDFLLRHDGSVTQGTKKLLLGRPGRHVGQRGLPPRLAIGIDATNVESNRSHPPAGGSAQVRIPRTYFGQVISDFAYL